MQETNYKAAHTMSQRPTRKAGSAVHSKGFKDEAPLSDRTSADDMCGCVLTSPAFSSRNVGQLFAPSFAPVGDVTVSL